MANPQHDSRLADHSQPPLRITEFVVDGLFGGDRISVKFPQQSHDPNEPSILILAGRNGTGKTTILRMIAGMLRLDFEEFRKVPFKSAELHLSTGQVVGVVRADDDDFPLIMSFDDMSIALAQSQDFDYAPEHRAKIDLIRENALPILGSLYFDFLELDRLPLRDRLSTEERRLLKAYGADPARRPRRPRSLAERVMEFVKDAQLNYSLFFREAQLGFLPQILDRLHENSIPPTRDSLISRLQDIRDRHSQTRRFGLVLEQEPLVILERLVASNEYQLPQQQALIETYIEMQETRQKSRDLIASRLLNFESIMSDFLLGKSVQIDAKKGLFITTGASEISEEQLSSGEYHFLCMMVAALLCQRHGSLIMIDEPELSLHVSWQRKLISALARCAAGASPTFVFATHSLVISSEHSNSVQSLSPLD